MCCTAVPLYVQQTRTNVKISFQKKLALIGLCMGPNLTLSFSLSSGCQNHDMSCRWHLLPFHFAASGVKRQNQERSRKWQDMMHQCTSNSKGSLEEDEEEEQQQQQPQQRCMQLTYLLGQVVRLMASPPIVG